MLSNHEELTRGGGGGGHGSGFGGGGFHGGGLAGGFHGGVSATASADFAAEVLTELPDPAAELELDCVLTPAC
jgi:hypothetical protein